MTIKNLNQAPQHLTTLANWHQAEWAHLNPGQTLQQRIEKMQPFLNQETIPTTLIYLDNKGTLCGSAAILESDMDTHQDLTPWLASVYVAPEHRNKGIGTKLIQAITNLAKTNNIKTLHLYTPSKETFYQSLGWQTTTKETYHQEPITLMQIPLNS